MFKKYLITLSSLKKEKNLSRCHMCGTGFKYYINLINRHLSMCTCGTGFILVQIINFFCFLVTV